MKAASCTSPPRRRIGFDRGVDSAAGRQQIVNHQHFIARFNGVNVDLQLIGAILQLIGLGNGFTRQLTRLAYRNKAHAQRQRDRGAEQEATRLSPYHFGNTRVFVALGQQFNAKRVGLRVFQ